MKDVEHLLRPLAAAFLCLWSGMTAAADFTTGGTAIMDCDITLSGQIAPGDAARFARFLEHADLASGYVTPSTLCLDSPGGSYSDGIGLAEIVSARGMTTAIGPGVRCESACSLVFMAGRILAGDGYSEAKRRLHPTGTLGFHAPGLRVQDGAYTEQSVNRAYEVAVLSVRELIEFRERANLNFPESLLLEMLGTPPNRMRRVETVGDAAMWKIEIFPIGNPAGGAGAMVWNACSNLQGYVWGVPPQAGPVPSDIIASIRSEADTVTIRTGTGFLGEGQPFCQISLGGTGYVDRDAIGYIDFPEAGVPGSFTALYKNMLFAPDTRIADLPAARPDDRQRLFARFVGPDPGRVAPACALNGDRARIANVRTFVNMRQSPALDAPVLRQLPLGAGVRIFGEPIITNFGGMRPACSTACGSARTSDPALMRRCIGSDSIWYKVMDDRGLRGFVSRRFLD